MFKNLIAVSVLIAAAICASSCSGTIDIPTDFPTPPPNPASTPVRKLAHKPDAELEKRIAAIAAEARGRVGVAAVVLETGDAATLSATERFPMQSVYKLPISMAAMEQVRRGELDLDEKVGVTKDDMVREGMRSPLRDGVPAGGEFTIRELIRLSIVESDGTASDVLMRVAGDQGETQRFLTQVGVADWKVINTEKEMGRDWETQYANYATPLAAVDLLRWLHASAGEWKPAGDRGSLDGSQMIMQFMWESNPGAMRLKRLLPAGTVVAHKTGTSGTRNGITAATNDIGIIYLPNGKHVAIAVFVSDSPADEKTREAIIAKVARAVWDRWGAPATIVLSSNFCSQMPA